MAGQLVRLETECRSHSCSSRRERGCKPFLAWEHCNPGGRIQGNCRHCHLWLRTARGRKTNWLNKLFLLFLSLSSFFFNFLKQ